MIEIENVSKVYPGGLVALDDINLKFKKGEFICLIGTSGSGKTTCMRMINRMNVPTKGKIRINGRDISKLNEVDLRRSIGYVIQQIGLMPHMSIYENIIMVPKLLKWPSDKMERVAEDLMKKAGLPLEYLDSYPSELSGGQQQRIGVIRALAADQEIILMDEPFGALDPITRENLQKLIKRLQKEMGKTVIFVTHDMDEALQLSDRTVVMDKGRVVQFDTPKNILTNPANDFVREMLGEERINQAKFSYESVEEIMIKSPYTVNKNETVKNAIELMHKNHVDTLFVVDDADILVGVVDIFYFKNKNKMSETIESYMQEATYVYSDTKIRDVVYYINDLGYRNMPVVNHEHELVGLVTRAAIVEAIYERLWKDYQPKDESQVDNTSTNGEV